MKYMGYVVTYAPQNGMNLHNYLLNGISNEEIYEPACAEMNGNVSRRSIFALFDGSESEAHGEIAAWIGTDMLREYAGKDFSAIHDDYFFLANNVLKGRTFEEDGKRVCATMGAFYIDGGKATAYNLGNVKAYIYHGKKLKLVSGEMPETVEVEELVENEDMEVSVERVAKKTAPWMGFMSDEYMIEPYVSKTLKVHNGDLLFLSSGSLFDVLDENDVLEVLNDTKVTSSEKAKMLIDLAVERDPDGNFSAMLVEADSGPKFIGIRLKTLVLTLTSALCIFGAVYGILANFGSFQKFSDSLKITLDELMSGRKTVVDRNETWLHLGNDDDSSEEDVDLKENKEDISENQEDAEMADQEEEADKPAQNSPVHSGSKPVSPKPSKNTVPKNENNTNESASNSNDDKNKEEKPSTPLILPEIPNPLGNSDEMELPIDLN